MSGTAFDPARLRRVQQLFDAAIELAGDAREQLLLDAAQSEADLVDEVRGLIAAEERDQGIDPDKVFQRLDAALRTLMPDALAPGVDVGPYLVQAEIGAGGMGRVFRARRSDHGIEHQVAIKVVRRDMLSDKARARFESERAVLARLRHAGICQFIDAGTLADGSPYFVMELLAQAVPIPAYADRERLDVRARIALFRKVLAAVAYAHQNLVVHRDIKSSNVLVLPDGQPKLLDFGIAKSLAEDDDHRRTATADRFFSIASAAPEQLTGAPVTVSCDIYSLGMLLYEVLAGVAPFDASNTSIPALIEQIVHRVPAPMHSMAASLDEAALASRQLSRSAARRALGGEIEDIVQRCLRKDPNERYHSVDALDDDLQRLQEGLPISIRRGQNGYRLRKFIARHRIASALTAALLISLVVSAWIVAVQNIRIRAERDQATEALAILRDAFLSADPARMSGDTVTARQVMDGAFAALEKHRAGGDAYADLMLTMAEVDLSLDNSERALRLTTQINALQDDALEPEQRQRARLLHASALSGSGKIDEARALLDAHRPVGSVDRLDWLLLNGRNLILEQQYDQAEESLREAVQLTAEAPPSDRAANRARRLLAESLVRQDQPARALASLDETLAWQRRELADNHPYVLLVELLIANELGKLDRADEAIALARRAVHQAESSYGDFSAVAARANLTLGNVLVAQGAYPEAATAFRKSRDAHERILGRMHPNTVRAQFNLAVALDEQDPEPEIASAELDRAFDDVRTSMGARSTFAAMAALRLVQHLAESGSRERALAMLSDPDLTAMLGADAPAALLEMAENTRAALARTMPDGD